MVVEIGFPVNRGLSQWDYDKDELKETRNGQTYRNEKNFHSKILGSGCAGVLLVVKQQ